MSEQPMSSPPSDRDRELIDLAEREMEAVGLQAAAAIHLPPGASLPGYLKDELDVTPDSIPGYSIVDEIHRGGQGVVYRALQTRTKRMVAIKVMREGPFAGRQDKARFEREVEVLGQLNHPHIVGIHDSGVAAGSFYFVMDYIAGQPLDAWMGDTKRTIEETLRLFATICEAVNAAHLRGVIHRDLKPGNIRIDTEGQPHILDFGLAKVAAASDASAVTVTGQFIGSLPWASPEQAEGIPGRIDVRTDVYSLGVILYQMLTARFPYEVVGTMRDVLDRIIRAEPARPSTIRRQINNEVETIVLKCLAKERERRYQTAGELARDITRYLNDEPIEAKRDSLGYILRKQLRRYRLPVAVAAGFVAMLTAGLVVTSGFYIRAERDRRRAEEAAARERAATTQALAAQRVAEAASADARRRTYLANIIAADTSLRLNDPAAVRARLDACPPELRGWEWGHLNSVADTSLFTLRGHGDTVSNAAFSPEGDRVVTVSFDNTPRIWDAATGRELAALRGHTADVACAVFNADGKQVLTGSGDGTARLWDAATGQELATLRGHTGLIPYALFSPDGRRILTASWDGTAKLWDTATRQELATLRGHTDNICSAAFSPNGERVVTASQDQTAKVWDADSGQELFTLRGHSHYIHLVTLSPDGKRVLTGSEDATARLWDAATGQELFTLRGHSRNLRAAVFSPDGRWVLTGSEDSTAKLWDAATGRELATLRGHTEGVTSAAFRPDGRRALTTSGDGTVKFWDVPSGAELNTLRGHTRAVLFAAYSPDGSRVVTTSRDKTAKLWDTVSGAAWSLLCGHQRNAPCAAFSPDGRRVVTASWDPAAKIWDAATRQELATLRGHTDRLTWVAFSPNGQRVVTASVDGTARLWDADTGQALTMLRGHTQGVSSAAFSPDGRRVVTTSDDATAKLWDAASGRELATLRGHKAGLYTAVFSPDGKRVATASADHTARLWDAATGQELTALTGHTDEVWDAEFSLDGKRIATASSDQTVKLWDAATAQELATLSGHSDGVHCACFSPDGSRIVTASHDGTAKIWDAGTGQELISLRRHSGFACRAAFSPDGQRVVTAAYDTAPRLWDSVPHSQRFLESQVARAAEERARSVVTALHERLADWKAAAEAVRADSTLDEEVHYQALNLVLKSSSAEIDLRLSMRVVLNPENGHYYESVFAPRGVSWDEAREAARLRQNEGLSGHLATITSMQENGFILENLGGVDGTDWCWLGAYQERGAPDYREPDGGWRWVTGEPFVFSNWAAGEPNDAGGNEDAAMYSHGGGQWNDLNPQRRAKGYIVEYEPPGPESGSATQPAVPDR